MERLKCTNNMGEYSLDRVAKAGLALLVWEDLRWWDFMWNAAWGLKRPSRECWNMKLIAGNTPRAEHSLTRNAMNGCSCAWIWLHLSSPRSAYYVASCFTFLLVLHSVWALSYVFGCSKVQGRTPWWLHRCNNNPAFASDKQRACALTPAHNGHWLLRW